MATREAFIEDRDALRAWLTAHHHEREGVWAVFYKGEKRTLPYDDVAEEALRFGWIDLRPGKVDFETKLYLAPRAPPSNWSALNKKRIAKLEAAGLLTEAGRKMVRLAKENVSWNALNDAENLVVPGDLERALTDYTDAKTNFQAFPPSAQRGIAVFVVTELASRRNHLRTCVLVYEVLRRNYAPFTPTGSNQLLPAIFSSGF